MHFLIESLNWDRKRSCMKIKKVYTHCKGIWNVYCPMKNECRFENWIIFYLLIGFFQTFHIMLWWIYCPAQELHAICFSFFKLHHILIYWVSNQVISIENISTKKKMNDNQFIKIILLYMSDEIVNQRFFVSF